MLPNDVVPISTVYEEWVCGHVGVCPCGTVEHNMLIYVDVIDSLLHVNERAFESVSDVEEYLDTSEGQEYLRSSLVPSR